MANEMRGTEEKDGGPAFPVPPTQCFADGSYSHAGVGMSLRDWFAGQALAGLMADGQTDGQRWDLIAQSAYFAADAMLVERSR